MTPHGSSTGSTGRIPAARNPYEELASPDAPQVPEAATANPYEALAADPDPHEKPYAGSYENPYNPSGASGGEARGPDDVPGGTEGPFGFTLRSDYDERELDYGHEDRMPYIRAVRRRRRSRLRRTLKAGIAIAVLLAFLAVGDRWAALYAEGKTAEKVQSSLKLHARPEVHIRGFPFVTQVAQDHLDHADVTIPDMPAGRISVAQVKGSVHDVQLESGDTPTAIKGAVLGKMRGDVLLDFDDLDRELGTSQVKFRAGGGPNGVLADGSLPVAGKNVKVRARANLQRTGDDGVGTTVHSMRLDVPGLFSYTPGKDGGLRLAKPLANRIRHDARQVKALFGVRSVAQRFGLTPQRAQQVRQSEDELHRLTGSPKFVDKLMRVNMVDAVMQHPALLKKAGIDPSLISGLKKLETPKLADKLSLSTKLPDIPGDVRLRKISVEQDGIHAKLTGSGMKFGGNSGS